MYKGLIVVLILLSGCGFITPPVKVVNHAPNSNFIIFIDGKMLRTTDLTGYTPFNGSVISDNRTKRANNKVE